MQIWDIKIGYLSHEVWFVDIFGSSSLISIELRIDSAVLHLEVKLWNHFAVVNFHRTFFFDSFSNSKKLKNMFLLYLRLPLMSNGCIIRVDFSRNLTDLETKNYNLSEKFSYIF